MDAFRIWKKIEQSPALFVQAVVFAYKRRDDKEDPEELKPVDEEHLSQRANASYKLLDALRAIPAHDRHGELASENIVAWVNQVREGVESWRVLRWEIKLSVLC